MTFNIFEHWVKFFGDEDGESSGELRDETIIVLTDQRKLRNIDVEIAVFIHSSHIIEELDWGIDNQVPKFPVIKDDKGISNKLIGFMRNLEGSLEAIVGSNLILRFDINERNNPSVVE